MSRAWMPIYWGDYLADTAHFTNTEHGCYLLLICFYWKNGKLPADEDAIRRIAKCSVHQWKKIRPVLVEKFSIDNCQWKHKRIDDELSQAIERSEAAHARAMQRWQCKSQSQSQSHKKERLDRAPRATRLSDDWLPTVEGAKFADLTIGPSRTSIELQKFKDYWRAKAGRDASKLDWDATWRNWIRNVKPNGAKNAAGNGVMEAIDKLIDRAGSGEIEGSPTMVDVTPGRAQTR